MGGENICTVISGLVPLLLIAVIHHDGQVIVVAGCLLYASAICKIMIPYDKRLAWAKS